MDQIIAQYITRKEYECSCCSTLPPDLNLDDLPIAYEILFDGFESIRENWGKPIRITSGYRCPLRNHAVGGKYLSPHLWGLALDLDLPNQKEVHELDALIEQLRPNFRRGRYTLSGTFIHIDCIYLVHPRASENWVEGLRWSG